MSDLTIVGRLTETRFKATDSDFTIGIVAIDKTIDGVPIYTQARYGEQSNNIIVKGEMVLLNNTPYVFECKHVNDPRFGDQYQLISVKRENPVEELSADDFRLFLKDIAGDAKAKAILSVYDDPREIFIRGDKESLMSVDGIGEKFAEKFLQEYEDQKDYSQAYVEFGKWGFTQTMTRRIVKAKGSVELAIKILKDNPYEFIHEKGIGFKTIDAKALSFGIKPNDQRRVTAFISNYFDDQAAEGNSWISASEFIRHLQDNIYECDVLGTVKHIKEDDSYLSLKHSDETRLSSMRYSNVEAGIADELIRILTSKSNMELKNIPEIINEVEGSQGWTYAPMQKDAISKMLEHNVFVLQGLAGTGKTSVTNAVLQILYKNHYRYESCALSGKAADNISQLTGKEGSTIHRLLAHNGSEFAYGEKQKLPIHAVVLDEISMVDIFIFYALLKAIPSGAKLIMLGDSGQLDSIGIGVMEPLIESGVVPSVTLTEVHRQALDSAIISHSLEYREGKVPEELKIKADTRKVYGAKKDLGYTFVKYEDEDKIRVEVMKIFSQMLKKFSVNDIQVITSTIATGKAHCNMINDACQRLANPPSSDLPEVELKRSEEETYILRLGDKVINTKNNRRTINADKPVVGFGDTAKPNPLPIYNGNTGIIEKITERVGNNNKSYYEMIVKFDGIGRVLLKDGDIKSIQLGYCITVHKSQGSTIPCVILALPFQFKLNSRELVYTALTRASKFAYVITSRKTLLAALSKTSKKAHKTNLLLFIKAKVVQILKEKKKAKEEKKVA